MKLKRLQIAQAHSGYQLPTSFSIKIVTFGVLLPLVLNIAIIFFVFILILVYFVISSRNLKWEQLCLLKAKQKFSLLSQSCQFVVSCQKCIFLELVQNIIHFDLH